MLSIFLTNIQRYKKPAVRLTIISAAVVVLTACGLLSNPDGGEPAEDLTADTGRFEDVITADIEKLNLRLKFPADWEGKYEISENEYVMMVGQKNGGLLFTLDREVGVIPESWFKAGEMPVTAFYSDNYTYMMWLPTDVQAPVEHGDEAVAEYQKMFSDLDWVFENMETIVKKEPQAENAGFKVVGTGDFLMEIPVDIEVEPDTDTRADIVYYFKKGGRVLGSMRVIPYFDAQQAVPGTDKSVYILDDESYRAAYIEIFDEDISPEEFSAMADSFTLRWYGGYTGIDLLTNAERYVRRGGERLTGMIAGFEMEEGSPAAVNVKRYAIEQNTGAPNGITLTNLEKTETIPLDVNFSAQIMPLAPPNYNAFDIYYMPFLSDWVPEDGSVPEPYDKQMFDFIATNGEIKYIIGRYIP